MTALPLPLGAVTAGVGDGVGAAIEPLEPAGDGDALAGRAETVETVFAFPGSVACATRPSAAATEMEPAAETAVRRRTRRYAASRDSAVKRWFSCDIPPASGTTIEPSAE